MESIAARFSEMAKCLLSLPNEESYWGRWRKHNRQVLRKLVEAERVKNGRNEETTMIIVDSRSVKNADTAEEKGYDAKKMYLELSSTSE